MVAQRTEGITVKNTFIYFEEDGCEEEDLNASMMGSWKKRQVSEPAVVFGRQLSPKPAFGSLQEVLELPGEACRSVVSGEDDFTDEDSFEEPETETEPRQVPHAASGLGGTVIFNQLDTMPWPQQTPAMTTPGLGVGGSGDGCAPTMGFKTAPSVAKVSQGEGADLFASYPSLQSECHVAPLSPNFLPVKLTLADDLVVAPAEQCVPPDWGETTTMMMRNLPNRYTQHMLVEEISDAGFAGHFDFLHLPIDPETNANKGYAFINFLDTLSSWRFQVAFEGKQMRSFNSRKYVSVTPAALQGFEANYAHYSTARCSRGNESARPLFLREPEHDLNRCGLASNVARRGGRRRNHGRSLVDEAVQERVERQEYIEQASSPVELPRQATFIYGGQRGRQGMHTRTVVAAAAVQQPLAEQRARIRFCPFCGGSCQPGHRFCQFCGASLMAVGMS